MTVPWTIDRDSEAPILKITDPNKETVGEVPRIPVQDTEPLEKRQINVFAKKNPYFSEGVPVAVRYEITNELQFKSGYIIGSIWRDTDKLWHVKLYPTHGGGQILYGKQGTKYRSALILSRQQVGVEVRGGAEMVLAPINSTYIIEEVLGGVSNVVSQTI